jgi:DNA-binding CsgD family transcriptional regulator/tetratricopeptide (TPR) repeat protein
MQLLERTSFLHALTDYAGEARQGDGRLVLLSGESGIGKTALLEAFQQRLAGARWLWGACDGLLTPRPLGPLFDIGARAGGELARLCGDGASRDELFAALLAELDSATALTVVVIEDVHWADESTLDLLSFLGRRLSRLKGLLLVSYRDDEVGADHPLRMVLGDVATQRSTRRMGLPTLSPEAVRELVGQSEVDAAELHRVTGGNPFYVCEIIEAGWPSIPPTVRDVVGARLARSTPAAREAVRVAAVIGTRIDRPLLAGVLAGPDPVIDECLASGFLIAEGTGVRFRHELVRMAVAATIAPHRKTELHARLLAALEEAADADPAVLAHHAEGAGDKEAVRRHAPEAARRSSALGAHREAAAQFERALRFADPDDRPALAALQEGLAREYSLLDRLEEAEQALRTALTLRRELGDHLAIGQDLRSLSETLWQLCEGEESARTAAEAVGVIEALPAEGPELAWAYANRADRLWYAGRRDEALAVLEKARDIGARLGQAGIESSALTWLGWALVNIGQDGVGLIEQGLRIALDAHLQEEAGAAYVNMQDCCVSLQRLDEAQRYYAEAMAFCERRELRFNTRCLRGAQADTLLLLGRWDEAADLCEKVLAIRGVSPANQLYPARILGTILGRRGDPDARNLLDRALALAEGIIGQAWVAQARAARAELLWLAGKPDLAADEARAAYDQTASEIDPWRAGSLAIWLSRLGARTEFPAGLPEPYELEMAGDRRRAAQAWERLGRPYDAALVWVMSSDEAGLRGAVKTLDDLGARATAAVARRRMKELGLTAIPRGPHRATRADPAGLTAREQEVLALLSEGLPDREISSRLFISERTVHHHVSAVLAKIGVSSRTAAAREAARMGIGI